MSWLGTPEAMSTSVWTRYPRNLTAFRGHGTGSLVLAKSETGWHLFDHAKSALALEAEASLDLERVILAVDFLYPPEGWNRVDDERWVKGEWTVLFTPAGWKVQHPKSSTRQIFRSADRARKWVDLRADRAGGTLGPRCRADTRASKTLPDVRVTEAERADAVNLAAEMNLTFSELVRASLKFVRAAYADDALVYSRTEGAFHARPGRTCAAREV